MKTKIDRMKHSQRITKRTLALALCVVMLFSALGATSVMTAIAQTIAPSADAQPTAGADAAAADASVPAGDGFSGSPGAGENSFFKPLTDQIDGISANQTIKSASVDEDTGEEKSVIASKGDADLAETGYSGSIAFAADFNSWSTSANTGTLSNNSADITISNNSAGSHEFKLYVEQQWWGCDSTGTMNATINSSWNLNSNSQNANNVGLNVTTAGNYGFRAIYSSGSWTIQVTSVPSGGSSDPEMYLYGAFNNGSDWDHYDIYKMTYVGTNSEGYNSVFLCMPVQKR